MARGALEATTYPLRAAARLTGLSPELLRAWERRYGAIEPVRTAGGTRRYRASDLERLRRLKAAVEAGHRIGEIARLDDDELRRLAAPDPPAPGGDALDDVLAAAERLDAAEVQRLLALQLSALGPARFAREIARALAREIGERWASGRLGVASEHLASGVLRSLLGASLVPSAAARLGPRVVFATPSGERHELGLQMAALTAMGAGANPVYLGTEVPVDELRRAIAATDASVLALSIVTPPTQETRGCVDAIRSQLPGAVLVWIGGAGAPAVGERAGVEVLADLQEIEQRVELLPFESR